MKKSLLIVLVLLISFSNAFSQTVEKIFETKDIKLKVHVTNVMPEGIMVDELSDEVYLINGSSGGAWIFNNTDKKVIFYTAIPVANGVVRNQLGKWLISNNDTGVFIDSNEIINIANRRGQISSGISFILKKGSGYIVYYVDKNGVPGAVDTEGKIYTSAEAMGYLKAYDSEKYAGSLERAEELGLKTQFLNNEVLVWGKTYYSNASTYKKMYGKNPYLLSSGLIQYDQNGYGYQMYFEYERSRLCIVNENGEREELYVLEGYAPLMENDFSGISTSWYVGFGGNIYYYVAGEDYTEVFRIRRTWGEPDFYAMAINGYTDDDYGAYVNEVLAGLSKADLRLLRNTVFALYGYHFNSADLAAHFDKEVWYTDEGKTSADITLPEHRAKLVEMIQALEAKM